MKQFYLSILLVLGTLSSNLKAQVWMPFAPGNTKNAVIDFRVYDNDLIVYGLFTNCGGNPAESIARWDGNSWQEFAGGIPDGVHSANIIDSVLYATPYDFSNDSSSLLMLQGNAWVPLGDRFYNSPGTSTQGFFASLFDVQKYNGELVVSGEFNRVGGDTINRVAAWNGSNWYPLGKGLSGNIPNSPPLTYPHQMLVDSNRLYVVGNFGMAGDSVCNGVAYWDGQDWHPLGAGFNSSVYGIGKYQGQIYVGGDFTRSGTTDLGRIARWNGVEWENPGLEFEKNGAGAYCFIHTLREIGGQFYIAGGFNEVTDGNQNVSVAGNVIRWDGSYVDLLDGGVNGDTEGIWSWQGKLLVGGFFTAVGPNQISASRMGLYDSLATGWNEPQLREAYQIYPNPTRDQINIQIPDGAAPTFFRLLDSQGRLLRAGKFEAQLSLADLPPAVYILQIMDESGQVVSSESISRIP